MNLSTGDRRRYRSFRSHLLPRTTGGKIAASAYLVLFLCAQWPLLAVANRDEPTVFGLPFLFVYLTLVYAAQILLLVLAVRREP